MTHVYCPGHVPHEPPQPSSPHTAEPQNGVHGPLHCPCPSQAPPPGHVPHDPPHPSLPHDRPAHWGEHATTSGACESTEEES